MISEVDRKRFFETHNWRFNRCLAPGLQCTNKAIRAHSIQNARVFDLLHAENHVSMFRLRISKSGPRIDLEDIGRNEASTFLGFCGHHDEEIFRPLDRRTLDLEDKEQLFLLAYRSVCRELHASMEGASKIQSAYSYRVEKGKDPSDGPSPAGMEAVGRMAVSWMTYRYRADCFDLSLLERNFESIEHDVFTFEDQQPAVAASCLFSIDEVMNGDDVLRAVLNIVPLSNTLTAVVLSFAERDAALARIALDRVRSAVGMVQKYELSKLLLERTENFALAPSLVRTWSAQKLERIRAAFATTMFHNVIQDDANLMLFS